MRLCLTLNENPNEDSAPTISLVAMMRDEEALSPLLDLPFLGGEDSTEPEDTETESASIPDEAVAPLSDVLDDMPELDETGPEPSDDAGEDLELNDDGRSDRQLLVELVLVEVTQTIRDGALPFAFDVIEPDPTHRRRRSGGLRVELPVLRIVAAPGVHIQVARATNPQTAFYVDVIRVQDVRVLPEPGEPIDIGQYLQTNGIPMRHDTDWGRDLLDAYNTILARDETARSFMNSYTRVTGSTDIDRESLNNFLSNMYSATFSEDMARVSIIPTDDGTIFYDSLCKRVLQVKVPRMSRSGAAESGNARARYGYTINQFPITDIKSVIIAATAEVEVIQYCFVNSTAIPEANIDQDAENLEYGIDAVVQRALAGGDAPIGVTGLTLEQIQMEPFLLYRVPQIEFVPNPGETIRPVIDFRLLRRSFPVTTPSSLGRLFHFTPREPWTSERIRYESPSSLTRELVHIGVDVGIGLIPVVGDIADISEVLVAAVTGRDHWGDRVGPFEISLMTLGAILPFVGNRSVRTLGTLIMGGALASAAAPLIDPEGDEAHEADAERGLE